MSRSSSSFVQAAQTARTLRSTVCPLFLCLLVPPAMAQATHESLRADLAQVHALSEAGKWSSALEALQTALERHGEQEYTCLHWAEIKEALTRCSFWKNYERPKAKDVVPGELLSWKPSSGSIKLRYKRGSGGLPGDSEEAREGDKSSGDFIRVEEGYYIHPMLFTGPYNVEFHASVGVSGSAILVEWDWNSYRGVTHGASYGFTFAESGGNMESAAVEIQAGEVNVLDRHSHTLRGTQREEYKVSVGKSSISAFHSGKRVLKVKRRSDAYGQFGFQDMKHLKEVSITGDVDPAWISGLIDERVQRDWASFVDGFDPLAQAPTALREQIEGQARGAQEFDQALPTPGEPLDEEARDRTIELIDEGESAAARDYLQDLEGELSASAYDWLEALISLSEGEARESVLALERVIEHAPTFFEAHLLRARLLPETADRLEAFHMLVGDFPEYAEAHEGLAQTYLYDGEFEKAEDVYTAALTSGLPAGALEDLGRTLLRSRRGPSWNNRYTHASKNFAVSSDISRSTCLRIATELEQAYRRYNSKLRRVEDNQAGKFEVYYFSGEAGYGAYCEGLMGEPAENTLGLYSPWLKQLLIWNSSDPVMTMRTVRHEGFHQYFDRLVGDSPIWLNEGLAEYYEQARFVDGRWRDDQLNMDHLGVLQLAEDEWTPLEEFLRLDNSSFRFDPTLHYAQAWALVHFLLNGGKESEAVLDKLLDLLSEGAGNKEAVRRAFEGVALTQFEADLRRYVRELGG